MARKNDVAKTEEQAPPAEVHQYVGPGGEVRELTDDEFFGEFEGKGFIRAGDVRQDHLDNAPDEEPKAEPAEVETPGEADAPDQLPVETDPPAGAQPDGKA